MSQAYQQFLLSEDSKQSVVINTHRGLFRYNWLPNGISSLPGRFLGTMECLLHGIPNVVVYQDDILITGSTEELHLKTLGKDLRRIQEADLKPRREKCVFKAPSVVYLGYRIDAQRLHPKPEK